jgi:hypothetical protein
MNRYFCLILYLGLLLVPGCNNDSGNNNSKHNSSDPESPKNTLTVMLDSSDYGVSDGDINVGLKPNITLAFSSPIDKSLINRSTINVYTMSAGKDIEHISYDFIDTQHKLVRLKFDETLSPVEKYHINIGKTIIAIDGSRLSNNKSFSFVTTEDRNSKVNLKINDDVTRSKIPVENVKLNFHFGVDIQTITTGDIKIFSKDLESGSQDLECKNIDLKNYNCILPKLDYHTNYYIIFDKVLSSSGESISGRFTFTTTNKLLNTAIIQDSLPDVNRVYNSADYQGNIYILEVGGNKKLHLAKYTSDLSRLWSITYNTNDLYIDQHSLFVTSNQVSILRFDNKGGLPVDLLTFDKNNGGFKYDDQINSFQYGKDGVIPLQVLLDYQSNIYVRTSNYIYKFSFNGVTIQKKWESFIPSWAAEYNNNYNISFDAKLSSPRLYLTAYNFDHSDSRGPYLLHHFCVVDVTSGESRCLSSVKDYDINNSDGFNIDDQDGYDNNMFYLYHGAKYPMFIYGIGTSDIINLSIDNVMAVSVSTDEFGVLWITGAIQTEQDNSYVFLQKCDNISGKMSCKIKNTFGNSSVNAVATGNQVNVASDFVVLTGVTNINFENNSVLQKSGFLAVVSK